jgi:hypothetical protein
MYFSDSYTKPHLDDEDLEFAKNSSEQPIASVASLDFISDSLAYLSSCQIALSLCGFLLTVITLAGETPFTSVPRQSNL